MSGSWEPSRWEIFVVQWKTNDKNMKHTHIHVEKNAIPIPQTPLLEEKLFLMYVWSD